MEHICVVCGHVHDEETEGKWEDLAEGFFVLYRHDVVPTIIMVSDS